jgi:hypothetical protein
VSQKNVEFGAVDRWFPLDLELGPDETAKLLTEQFRPRRRSKVFRAFVELVASMPAQILQLESDGVTMVQAWTLLGGDGSELDPIAVAWACTVPHPAGCTPGEFVDVLLPDVSPEGDLRLYQPMDLQPLDTPLGQAHRLRARFASDTPHGLVVREAIRIFWLFPGEEVALVFQVPPLDDLPLAADVAGALTELAEHTRPV